MNDAAKITTTAENKSLPLPGTMMPEQGGIFAGVMPAENGQSAYGLIVPVAPEAEAESLEWGGYGKKIEDLSASNGLTNTRALVDAETDHPAAQFCAALTISGFNDFYLPARREASLMAATVPHLFTPSYHWTSTQFSAYDAFIQDFSGGTQDGGYKVNEWRVRAVRRFIIN